MRASPVTGPVGSRHRPTGAVRAGLQAAIGLAVALAAAPALRHANEAVHDSMGRVWPFSRTLCNAAATCRVEPAARISSASR